MSASRPSFQEQFRSSPALFVQNLDVHSDRILLAAVREPDFHQASFLDQRLLTPERPREWIAWAAAADVGPLPDSAQFIFHIGHVGSTLISRLLGELPAVLPVREPLLLRLFAELHRTRERPEAIWPPKEVEARLSLALGWLSRTFRPEQSAMIKATSFASELAGRIQKPGRKSLFLFARPDTYCETILAGENARQELSALGPKRLERLHERIGAEPWRLWGLSPGERAAMAWACEMTALEAGAAAAEEGGVLWLDFERFLEAPADRLRQIARHFGHDVEAAAEDIVAGPIMRTYSKAPEHAYSPELRASLLAEARRLEAEELRRARIWLDEAAAAYPAIGAAVSRAAQGSDGCSS